VGETRVDRFHLLEDLRDAYPGSTEETILTEIIQFESRQDDAEIAHLVESTVRVNEEHPAYRRAAASRSEGYHVALAVALALAPLAVDPVKEHGFIITFLARWGAAIERRGKGRRR
jgi:hypothetical protein